MTGPTSSTGAPATAGASPRQDENATTEGQDMTTETLTAGEAQEKARQIYRESVAAEMPLSGARLGEMFDRSGRWGRDRIAEVKAEAAATPEPVAEPVADAPLPVAEEVAEAAEPVAVALVEQVEEPAAVDVLEPVPAAVAALPQSGGESGEAQVSAGVAEPEAVRVPWQARAWAWLGFGLGSLASIAANVAHAQDTAGAKLAGAFVPVALIIAVEIMSRPIWQRPGWQWQLARYGGTGLVALVTAVMSYGHMHGLLLSYDESPLNAAIGPLAVDGLMVISGFAILAMSHKRNQS